MLTVILPVVVGATTVIHDYISRKKSEEKAAATLIQSMMRGYISRKKSEEMAVAEKEKAAATLIQSMMRGYISRKKSEEMAVAEKSEKEKALADKLRQTKDDVSMLTKKVIEVLRELDKFHNTAAKKIAWKKLRTAYLEVKKRVEYLDESMNSACAKFNEGALEKAKHEEQQAQALWKSLVEDLSDQHMELVDKAKQTDHDLYEATRAMKDVMFIKIRLMCGIYGRITKQDYDVAMKKQCPPGFGLAEGSMGFGFYYRDSPNLPRDLQEDWQYIQDVACIPECSICLADACRVGEREVIETLCGHVFCNDCISDHMKRTIGNKGCPMCREPLEILSEEILPYGWSRYKLE